MLDYEFFYIVTFPIFLILQLLLWKKKINKIKVVFISLFFYYIIALLAVTLFPIPIQWLQEMSRYWWQNNNFIPLSSIFEILNHQSLGLFLKAKQILWNIILFIPLWFFVPLIWIKKQKIHDVILIGLWSSIFIEFLQFFISFLLWFHYKSTDIDDIILNTLGFIIGFFLYKITKNVFWKQ